MAKLEMIYKINFDITKVSQLAYVQISQHIDIIKSDCVTTQSKEKMNLIITILQDEKVTFTVEEIKE